MAEPAFLGDPILIRFDGLDAERHEIEMSALADSLKGLSRIIGVAANFTATGRYVYHRDSLAVRVVARPPEPHCFELWAWVRWVGEHPYFSATTSGLTVAVIAYIFNRAAGQREEMKHLKEALDQAIDRLGTRDDATVTRLLSTIDKMADALRPAVKQAAAPVGDTVGSLTIGDAGRKAVVVGPSQKRAIFSDASFISDIEITEEQDYHVVITELDMDSGSCRVSLMDDPEGRFPGTISDPAFALANNSYARALASKEPVKVRAKARIKDGKVDHLFISDASRV